MYIYMESPDMHNLSFCRGMAEYEETTFMKNRLETKIISVVVAAALFFLLITGTTSAFTFRGYTYNVTKSPLSNTQVSIEEYSFGMGGPPVLLATYSSTSNATGYFSVQNIQDNFSSNYKIILRHINSTTGYLDYIGQSLPAFPYFEIIHLTQGSPIDFYLKAGGTMNITATNGTAPQNFRFMVKDTRLGYPIAENFDSEVTNATVYIPADRNYSIMIYPNQSFPVSYDMNNITGYTNSYANITFNTSNTLRKVSGYANLSDGSANFSDLKIIAYLMEPGNMIFQDFPLPYNMSEWCKFGPQPCAGDIYDATTGYYNITLPGAAMTANILLFATARNGSNYYGAFRNIPLDYSSDPVLNFNFSLQTLLGDVTTISVTNASADGPPGTTDITTKKLSFWLQNSTGANITNAHVEIEVDYASYGGSAFNWMADISQSSNGIFSIPVINADITKINIFTQGSAPLKTSKTAAQLATSPVMINLSAFSPGDLKNGTNPFSNIVIDMLKSNPTCDVPYPPAGCSLFPAGRGQNMSDFNPLKIVIGGGKISMRMTLLSNGITVHYKNVDMLASGPPDALFDSSANQSQNGSSMDQAWRFGSMGPEIYDEVLIGIPLGAGTDPNNVSVKLGKLYDENWNAVWNLSAGNSTADLPSEYDTFNTVWFTPSGMPCSTGNINAACYINVTGRMVWLAIPHFSGIGPTVSGTSGNVTVNLTNSTGYAGSSAALSFMVNDTANTTAWYNITFPNGFNAGSAIVNVTINGTADPTVWQRMGNPPRYVNVSSINPSAAANLSTNQYINISGISVPQAAGNYAINVTTSNNVFVSLNYTVDNVPVPPVPAILTNATGNFWVNYTWQAGAGNGTNSYNVSVNGIWTNGTTNTYSNTSVGPHNWSNITVFAYNSSGSGSLNPTPASNNTRVLNNAPVQSLIGNKNATAGSALTFTITATDADSDAITYGTNAPEGALNPATGVYSWTPAHSDAGNYTWYFNSSDGYGGSGNETITVSVISYGVILTNVSALANTTTGANATYALNLTNNGTAPDSFTLTVDYPNSASITGLNITSPLSLAAGQTRIFVLNVTNNLSGTFYVNVTAHSNNDTTRFGYLNTTTIVNRTITNNTIGTIIDPSTFIVNATLNLTSPSGDVTVTISNGTNASVNNVAVTSISVDSLARVSSTYAANLSGTNKFIGENLTLGPDGAHFSPDIQIRFNYTAAQLTAAGIAESELAVKFYNTSTNAWETLTVFSRNTTGDYIMVNTSHFSTLALIGVPSTAITTSSSGGGGSGGGGLITSEPYENIAKAERYDKYLIADTAVTYTFTAPEHGIYQIDVTGKENENDISLRVEALKGTSRLISIQAPGIVYKNVNVWAGTKKLKETIIRFKVENSWLESNSLAGSDIKMAKWDGSNWNQIETVEKTKDSSYTYYEAKTDTFSSFAIIGLKGSQVPGSPDAAVTRTPVPAETARGTPAMPAEKASGFEVIAAITMLAAVYLSGRKIR